jgi:hypothetical protein
MSVYHVRVNHQGLVIMPPFPLRIYTWFSRRAQKARSNNTCSKSPQSPCAMPKRIKKKNRAKPQTSVVPRAVVLAHSIFPFHPSSPSKVHLWDGYKATHESEEETLWVQCLREAKQKQILPQDPFMRRMICVSRPLSSKFASAVSPSPICLENEKSVVMWFWPACPKRSCPSARLIWRSDGCRECPRLLFPR